MSNGFDIAKHVRKVTYTKKDGTRQEKEMLDTAPRLAWFRNDYPAASGWRILTECVNLDAEGAFFKAEILNPDGVVVATGHKFVSSEGFANYCEKAETQAIGRALQVAGYGTIYALERESDDEEPEAEGSQVTPKPKKALSTKSPGHWIDNENVQERFWTWCHEQKGLSDSEVLQALGVEAVRDFPGTMLEARQTIEAWVNQRGEEE